MPSQLLHVLFGEDAFSLAVQACRGTGSEGVASRWSESARGADSAGVFFALGCQGPDIFYHNQRTRPLSIEYGTLLHRRGYGTFCAALLKEAFSGRAPAAELDPAAAYALGFLTHAFLDRGVHPYIVCKSGWVSPSKPETERYARCHAFFERILDVLMIERLRRADAASWDQEARLARFGAADAEAVGRLIAAALRSAFPERAAADAKLVQRIQNAFKDASGFYRITNPARTSLNRRLPDGYDYLRSSNGRASVALIHPELFPYGIDYLNLGRVPWSHPCRPEIEDRRSFPELYAEALDKAVSAIVPFLSFFAATGTVLPDFASRIGDGGLSALGADGQPCAPTHSDPLPLDEVLDRQYRLRLDWIASRG